MEKIYTLQKNLTGDPIKIEITFLEQSDATAIQLRSNVAIRHKDPENMAGAAVAEGDLLARLERIRSWERQNLPQPNSPITHDIFRLLGAGHPTGDAYTIKQVGHATGCSERTLRKQLQRFEDHGWITRSRSATDKRNSHVYPTSALKQAYQQWLHLYQLQSARIQTP